MTSKELANLRALVIGGSAGIGYASARSLATDGAQVTIASRSRSGLDEAADILATQGLHVDTIVCDAYSAADVAASVQGAGRDGRLDICVVIPGGGSIKPVLLYDDDEFGATVDFNVRPVFLAVKYAGRAMVRAGGGSIVAISSSAARFSTRYVSAYAAGKAAVDQLISVAADELGSYGVRANSVRPGLTRSRMAGRSFDNPDYVSHFLKGQPIARGGEVEDIAGAVRYLAGPESAWVTGQHISVDGGHTLRGFVDYADFMDLPDQRQIALEHQGGPDAE